MVRSVQVVERLWYNVSETSAMEMTATSAPTGNDTGAHSNVLDVVKLPCSVYKSISIKLA